ncbi:uncharacterized protein LOC132720575 [Ruditapes philippinarum]|uniref:uncharacterized protein LOC132720575 n=1 Tax=Ruditapes philippinarum TaxID=129788 RepID=UPI00295B6367|nr:uncharacterized protein LOC132720575 [Ruditapes philippinarum]
MLEKHNVMDKPSQVYNCDETGWSGKECARERVIGPKSGHVFQQNNMTNDHVTAHLCVSADGSFIPTMVIFKGGFPHRNYKDGLPGSWLFSSSDSGYMDTELFLQWFVKAFVPNCGKERPVILLMDNHESHISLPLVEAARKENVVLVGLPSHTTHYLQPLDVKVIGPLKDKVSRLASSVSFSRPGCSIGKSRLPVLLSYAIDQTAPSTVKDAFRLAGIMPVNPDAIDTSQLVPPSFPVEERGDNPTITCETCGQFIGQNPLVKRGVVPASLADILVPPPAKPMPQKKRPSKAVTSARVLSGDEMLEILKEREDAEVKRLEEKKQREEDREMKRKQKIAEDELKAAKKQKRETEKNEREQEKLRERERKEKFGKLADRKYTCGVCGVRGRVFDEQNGVEWYGCDNDLCVITGWYHFECLSESEKKLLRERVWMKMMCSGTAKPASHVSMRKNDKHNI